MEKSRIVGLQTSWCYFRNFTEKAFSVFSRGKLVNKYLNKALDKCLLSHNYLIIQQHVAYKKEKAQYNFSYSKSKPKWNEQRGKINKTSRKGLVQPRRSWWDLTFPLWHWCPRIVPGRSFSFQYHYCLKSSPPRGKPREPCWSLHVFKFKNSFPENTLWPNEFMNKEVSFKTTVSATLSASAIKSCIYYISALSALPPWFV